MKNFPAHPEKEKSSAHSNLINTFVSFVVKTMSIDRFNIRVYGLLIDEGRILVSDEFRLGILMTKFPGGGLQFGEGIVDCLKREFMEELHAEIINQSHVHTTENYFSTNLLPFESQLINVYYKVEIRKPFPFKTTDRKFDFQEMTDGAQSFRWISLSEFKKEDLTFPVDQELVDKLT